MAAHISETAQETGDFRCERWHQQTHVTNSHRISRRARCGNGRFDTRCHEPAGKSS